MDATLTLGGRRSTNRLIQRFLRETKVEDQFRSPDGEPRKIEKRLAANEKWFAKRLGKSLSRQPAQPPRGTLRGLSLKRTLWQASEQIRALAIYRQDNVPAQRISHHRQIRCAEQYLAASLATPGD